VATYPEDGTTLNVARYRTVELDKSPPEAYCFGRVIPISKEQDAMSDQEGQRIQIVLRWIQILDNLEPFYKDTGEFVFRSKVESGGKVHEKKFPEQGYYSISDKPGWNRLEKLNKVLFEGVPGESLVLELTGEELDQFTANDHLDHYRREFSGDLGAWLGHYEPVDEGSADPENMKTWRICYDILKVD
jgi:hypothetical protein